MTLRTQVEELRDEALRLSREKESHTDYEYHVRLSEILSDTREEEDRMTPEGEKPGPMFCCCICECENAPEVGAYCRNCLVRTHRPFPPINPSTRGDEVIHPGELVECRTFNGEWVLRRAVSGVVRGGSMAVVMVLSEDDWREYDHPVSEASNYRAVWDVGPNAYGWPADSVRPHAPQSEGDT